MGLDDLRIAFGLSRFNLYGRVVCFDDDLMAQYGYENRGEVIIDLV